MARFSNDHMPSVATQARTAWQQRLNTASQACEISLQAQLDRFSQLEWDLFATSEEMHVDMTDIYGKPPGAASQQLMLKASSRVGRSQRVPKSATSIYSGRCSTRICVCLPSS